MSENTAGEDTTYTVRHEPSKYRYEILDGDTVAGTAAYLPDVEDRVWDFNSTHVRPEYEGKGLAAKLVNFALTDAKAQGHEIVATCSYVEAYLKRHPELA